MQLKKYANYKEDFRQLKRRQLISRANTYIISAGVTLTVLVLLLFFVDLFDIRTVKVTSPRTIPANEVFEKTWEVLHSRKYGIARRRNSILFSPNAIIPFLRDSYPRIDKVTVRRDSLHSITVDVIERVPVGLWCLVREESCYYFDGEGIAFSSVASSSGFLFVAINDGRDRSFDIGDAVAPESWRNQMLEVKKMLQFGGISVRSFEIMQEADDEFHVTTSEGWKILYVQGTDVRQQTDSLFVFLRETIADETRKNLDYVDLRIEDRIYYKTR